jgi:hypothetical protein
MLPLLTFSKDSVVRFDVRENEVDRGHYALVLDNDVHCCVKAGQYLGRPWDNQIAPGLAADYHAKHFISAL